MSQTVKVCLVLKIKKSVVMFFFPLALFPLTFLSCLCPPSSFSPLVLPIVKGFISTHCSVWLQFLLFLLFPMHVFLSVNNVYPIFLCGVDRSVFGCTENKWTWSWEWKVKAALTAKSIAIKTMQSGWMLRKPEDNIFLKIRKEGRSLPVLFLWFHNIKLVALEGDQSGWLDFVCSHGLGNGEAEEHVCDTGGWWQGRKLWKH